MLSPKNRLNSFFVAISTAINIEKGFAISAIDYIYNYYVEAGTALRYRFS